MPESLHTGRGDPNSSSKSDPNQYKDPISSDDKMSYLDQITKSSGGGGFDNYYQTFFRGIDRFQHNFVSPNMGDVGLTFITRPRLCLNKTATRARTEFRPLDTTNINSAAYAIRCLLDTKYAHDDAGARDAGLFDLNNPFLTPVQNGLQGISGYPDPIIQTLTSDAGFHSEDQTTALGYDQLNKTYDLQLTFKDIQGGPIAAIFYYWFMYIGYVVKGLMPAYKDDIYRQRLNYTVSIYRFALDPTRRFITNYSKATGCFPKSLPLGAMINFSEGELINNDLGKFTIPFVANKIEYNDYPILMDFNMLVDRYTRRNSMKSKRYPMEPESNYRGIPYIDLSKDRHELFFS